MMTMVEVRRQILKDMHDYVVRCIGDEEAYMTWVTFAVPDGYDEDDLISIAEDDDLWSDCVKTFKNLVFSYENKE